MWRRCLLAPSVVLLWVGLGACNLHRAPDILTCDVASASCDGDTGAADSDAVDADGDGLFGDDDCDDDDAEVGEPAVWYADEDGDGWGDETVATEACDQPSGFVSNRGDCDDSSSLASPDITEETCGDGLDNDCDGTLNDCTFYGEVSTLDADAYLWTEAPGSYNGDLVPIAVGRDITGDNIPEIVFGQQYTVSDSSSAGGVYIFEGSAVGDQAAKDAHAVIYGEQTDLFGGALVTGDVSGDGQADLVIGAHGYSSELYSDSGVAAVFYGPIASGSHVLSDADLLIVGVGEDAYGGWGVSLGNVTGGGNMVLSSSIYAGTSSQGVVYVMDVDVVTPVITVADAVATIVGADSNTYFGMALEAEGDVDGDGVDDLLVGSFYSDTYTGAAWLFHGPLSGKMTTRDATFSVTGDAQQESLGDRIAHVGDIDGDGLSDIAVGAYKYDGDAEDSGRVLVYAGPVGAGSDALATVIGDTRVLGTGSAVDAYDYDKDGLSDLVVGSWKDSTQGSAAGGARMFYGPLAGTVEVADFDAMWVPTASAGYFGRLIAAGDLDGDNDGDVLVGSFLSPGVVGGTAMGGWLFRGEGY